MSQPLTHLEPAERDPKKLRRTAFILVGIMAVSGPLILLAYNREEKNQVKDDRPAFIARITEEKDLPLVRQDGSKAAICDLKGKVNVIQTLSASQPDTAKIPTEVMQRLARHYAGNKDFVLTSLVLDPGPPENAVPTLLATSQRIGATLPEWWVGTTEPELLHKYVKKELKADDIPHLVKDQWVYDTALVVIDRNRHIRRGVVHQKRGGEPYVATFDFDQAAEWDARGVKTGTDLNNAQQLEQLLIQTIDALLAEPIKS